MSALQSEGVYATVAHACCVAAYIDWFYTSLRPGHPALGYMRPGDVHFGSPS